MLDFRKFTADDIPIFIQQYMKDCIDLNKRAMVLLYQDNDDASFELLQEAKGHLKQWHGLEGTQTMTYIKVKSLTLNNFGCFYKKQGKAYAALKSLQQALDLEKIYLKHFDELTSTDDIENAFFEHARTYLNMCAIHSQLGKHHEAIQKTLMAITFIKRSIRLLVPYAQAQNIPEDEDEHQEIFKIVHIFTQSNNFQKKSKNQSRSSVSYSDKRKQEDLLMKFTNQYLASDFRSIEVIQEKFESVDDLLDEGGDMAERKQRFKGHMMTLIAAYYNLGASFEHLKKFEMALLAFQRAMTYCL